MRMEDKSDTLFRMVIVDVFNITGRGLVITGRVASGIVSIGDIVCLLNAEGELISNSLEIKNLEVGFSRPRLSYADAGLNVALMLGEVDLKIESGYIVQGL